MNIIIEYNITDTFSLQLCTFEPETSTHPYLLSLISTRYETVIPYSERYATRDEGMERFQQLTKVFDKGAEAMFPYIIDDGE